MKVSELKPGMEVAIHKRSGFAPDCAVVVEPKWANFGEVAVAVRDYNGVEYVWRPRTVKARTIIGPYAEAAAAAEAEDEARRKRIKERNARDDEWQKRRLAVLDRLGQILALSYEDRKMRYSIGTLQEDRPPPNVDMAIEDMERIAAMLEARKENP
jgi:hypothetical protein